MKNAARTARLDDVVGIPIEDSLAAVHDAVTVSERLVIASPVLGISQKQVNAGG
jgi:hypothetical protein